MLSWRNRGANPGKHKYRVLPTRRGKEERSRWESLVVAAKSQTCSMPAAWWPLLLQGHRYLGKAPVSSLVSKHLDGTLIAYTTSYVFSLCPRAAGFLYGLAHFFEFLMPLSLTSEIHYTDPLYKISGIWSADCRTSAWVWWGGVSFRFTQWCLC